MELIRNDDITKEIEMKRVFPSWSLTYHLLPDKEECGEEDEQESIDLYSHMDISDFVSKVHRDSQKEGGSSRRMVHEMYKVVKSNIGVKEMDGVCVLGMIKDQIFLMNRSQAERKRMIFGVNVRVLLLEISRSQLAKKRIEQMMKESLSFVNRMSLSEYHPMLEVIRSLGRYMKKHEMNVFQEVGNMRLIYMMIRLEPEVLAGLLVEWEDQWGKKMMERWEKSIEEEEMVLGQRLVYWVMEKGGWISHGYIQRLFLLHKKNQFRMNESYSMCLKIVRKYVSSPERKDQLYFDLFMQFPTKLVVEEGNTRVCQSYGRLCEVLLAEENGTKEGPVIRRLQLLCDWKKNSSEALTRWMMELVFQLNIRERFRELETLVNEILQPLESKEWYGSFVEQVVQWYFEKKENFPLININIVWKKVGWTETMKKYMRRMIESQDPQHYKSVTLYLIEEFMNSYHEADCHCLSLVFQSLSLHFQEWKNTLTYIVSMIVPCFKANCLDKNRFHGLKNLCFLSPAFPKGQMNPVDVAFLQIASVYFWKESESAKEKVKEQVKEKEQVAEQPLEKERFSFPALAAFLVNNSFVYVLHFAKSVMIRSSSENHTQSLFTFLNDYWSFYASMIHPPHWEKYAEQVLQWQTHQQPYAFYHHLLSFCLLSPHLPSPHRQLFAFHKSSLSPLLPTLLDSCYSSTEQFYSLLLHLVESYDLSSLSELVHVIQFLHPFLAKEKDYSLHSPLLNILILHLPAHSTQLLLLPSLDLIVSFLFFTTKSIQRSFYYSKITPDPKWIDYIKITIDSLPLPLSHLALQWKREVFSDHALFPTDRPPSSQPPIKTHIMM